MGDNSRKAGLLASSIGVLFRRNSLAFAPPLTKGGNSRKAGLLAPSIAVLWGRNFLAFVAADWRAQPCQGAFAS